jgi:hypothetical protein
VWYNIIRKKERGTPHMMTYIIEIAQPTDTFWTLEKRRANSLEEAIAELKEVYGKDAIIGYTKCTY